MVSHIPIGTDRGSVYDILDTPSPAKDKYLPPERVHATLLSPETLRCHPTMPAAASGINTEVGRAEGGAA